MPRRLLLLAVPLLVAWLALTYLRPAEPTRPAGAAGPPASAPTGGDSADAGPADDAPLPGEALLLGFGDPELPPIDDLRRIHRVVSGYFSIVKDHSRHPIGGNADLAAVLRGENAHQQAFIPPDHRVFGADGRLVDRWGSPLFVHPLAARAIELRSAGPDRRLFTPDDLQLDPTGVAGGAD